jgi:hypothetical protein
MAYDNKLKDGIGFGAIISINSQDYLDVLNWYVIKSLNLKSTVEIKNNIKLCAW